MSPLSESSVLVLQLMNDEHQYQLKVNDKRKYCRLLDAVLQKVTAQHWPKASKLQWINHYQTRAQPIRRRLRRNPFIRAMQTKKTRTWSSSISALLSIFQCRCFCILIWLFMTFVFVTIPKTLNPDFGIDHSWMFYEILIVNSQECIVKSNRDWKACQMGISYWLS